MERQATSRFPILIAAIVVSSAALGLVYIGLVKPGTPSDEFSHWLNVLYYAKHHGMPKVGAPSVTQEAQQPPLAYAIAALLKGTTRTFLTLRDTFVASRLLGGVEWLLTLFFSWRILGRLLPEDVNGRVVGFAYLALSPMLLAMAWSVQNDTLALLLGFAALDYALAVGRDSFSVRHGVVLGIIVAAGLLAKATVWPLLVTVPIWLLVRRHGRKPWLVTVAFAATILVVAGWWFVRNALLYGDLLGPGTAPPSLGATAATHVSFLHNLGSAVENAVTYLWLPTEYWRNFFHAPGVLKALLVLLTGAIVIIGTLALVQSFGRFRMTGGGAGSLFTGQQRSGWFLVGLTGLMAFGGWLIQFVGELQPHTLGVQLAARLAYLALPLWAGLVALTAGTLGRLVPRLRPVVPIVVVVVMLVLNAWVLRSIHDTHIPAGYIINL